MYFFFVVKFRTRFDMKATQQVFALHLYLFNFIKSMLTISLVKIIDF